MSWIGDVKEAELLKDEQLINLHKRYVMSQTDRTVSMQYRQNDARDRLEKRLKNVKTNGDEDDESTAGTRPVSRVGKELAKRLASPHVAIGVGVGSQGAPAAAVDDEVVETHDTR
jgi:hypothetical protein